MVAGLRLPTHKCSNSLFIPGSVLFTNGSGTHLEFVVLPQDLVLTNACATISIRVVVALEMLEFLVFCVVGCLCKFQGSEWSFVWIQDHADAELPGNSKHMQDIPAPGNVLPGQKSSVAAQTGNLKEV